MVVRYGAIMVGCVVMLTHTSQQANLTTLAPAPAPETSLAPREGGAMGELVVSRFSQYCDWTESMGPVCNYTGTDQVVVVPSGLRLGSGQLEVEVHNASTVHVYPTCVSWVQIYSAALVSTFPSEGGSECRTWLRIYTSTVDMIEHGVKDLTLVGTHVNTINLVDQRDFMAINSTITSIEALDWEGYRATVQNSVINRLSNVVARDSWYILNAQFGSVTSRGIVFDAREMSVVNTTINHIATQGLTIVKGVVSFANVTLTFLEKHAIEVTSPAAFLSLTNVTIHSAFIPCIFLLDRERLSLSNVTVMGLEINQSSPYFRYLEDEGTTSSDATLHLEENHPACSVDELTLRCDFANISKVVEVRGEEVQGYRVIEIHNTKALQVSSTTCGVELHLHSVNATLPHITADNTTSKTVCNIAISAWNSSLNVIWARHVTSLNLTDSTVKRLHDGKLEAMWLSGSSVEEVDKVVVAGQGAMWNNSLFLGPINVTLTAPLTSRNVQLLLGAMREGSLIMDHPGQTSKISGWRNSWMERHSMVVRRGSRLELSDVVTMRAAQEAVLLEEEATVKISNLKAVYRSYHIISVASRDQVEFGDSVLREEADVLIHVRVPPVSVDDQSNFTLSDTHVSPFCSTIPFNLEICDFSSVSQANVSVDLGVGRRSNRVIIKGAASVLLLPSCVEKVMLVKVGSAQTVQGERNCATWLEATGVHLINITNGVHDLTLTNCRVDLLAPDRQLRDLDLEGSRVERMVGVAWAGYMGVVNNSQLGTVEGLRAGSRMMMSNSSIEMVRRDGIVLEAEAVIANSTIGEIQGGGITINGSARMQDVQIRKVATGGIVVLSGLLVLVNVKIDEAEDVSIAAGAQGGVSFQNVSVAGQRVEWQGYLVPASGFQSLSLRHYPAPANPYPYPASFLPFTITPTDPASPQASSRVQGQTTTAVAATESRTVAAAEGSVSQDTVTASTSISTSWRWAAPCIGFFLGFLVASCVVFVVKVIKPNKGMLTLPSVLWKVQEDQHELLQEDQALHQQDRPANNKQRYSSLPVQE